MATEKQLALKKAIEELVAEKVRAELLKEAQGKFGYGFSSMVMPAVDASRKGLHIRTRRREPDEENNGYDGLSLLDAILGKQPYWDSTPKRRLARLRLVRAGLASLLTSLDAEIAGLEQITKTPRKTPSA